MVRIAASRAGGGISCGGWRAARKYRRLPERESGDLAGNAPCGRFSISLLVFYIPKAERIDVLAVSSSRPQSSRLAVTLAINPGALPRTEHPAGHGSCDCAGAMEAITKRRGEETAFELDSELETWDWARTAGVSAEELREVLEALLSACDLRKAA